ncbi:MAG: TonB-dependent hemoglobin/transferrin/lactoferrin family receptor [Rubrivivax sp.]
MFEPRASRALPFPGPAHAVALAVASLLASGAAIAQSAPAATAPGPVGTLPRLVVSATRIEVPEDEVPATVTSKTAQEVQRRQARDLKTLLDDEPGISVRQQPARMSAVFGSTGRGGNEGINVRGLEGNQVLLQSDGVRLPMVYDSGPFVAGRGDYVDVEAYKRVELLRGPSSTSYGSDGLAGAVSFVTKDPADLLTLGQPLQGALKLGFASADNSWVSVPSVAFREGSWQGMVLASLRRGHELENQATTGGTGFARTQPNPQDRRSDYVLAKLLFQLDERQQFKLTAEQMNRRVDTPDILTIKGMPNVNANVTSGNAREDVTRTMAKLDYRYNDPRNPWFQAAQAWFYLQDADTRQFGEERYTSPPASWSRRTRDTLYGERGQGLGAQFESNFEVAAPQRLLYGFDISNSRVHSRKDGAHYNASGALITTGGFVANQSFPDTDYRLFGAFVQDEITLGALTLTPALRLDRYELAPETGNPLFTANNAVAPTRLSGGEVSPRLGAVWKLSPLLQPFAQYAHGFRAPTPWQVNGGISNTTATPPYRSIGNPDLKPEIGDSIELGLRGRTATLRYSLALFKSRYRDFIVANTDVTATTTVPLDPGMGSNTVTYQSVNVNRAEIQGVEAAAAWIFLPGWTIEARYARAKGEQIASNGTATPLPTIEPDKGTLKLGYERAGQWGGGLTVTGQKSQHRPYASSLYIPKGYVVADLSGWWDITRQLQLSASIQNIGDATYIQWSDVRGQLATTTIADAYTQPGRNFSASVRYQF